MNKFVLALLLVQAALVVQCTTVVKREELDQGFITDDEFQQICGTIIRDIWLEVSPDFSKNRPRIKYIYPCDKCNTETLSLGQMEYNQMFYKYDKETDFFVTNVTLTMSVNERCECQLNPKEEDIAKAIDAYKKQYLDLNCSKKNPTSEKAFDLDPAKLKECFQSTKEGKTKVKIAVMWPVLHFPVLVQEILDEEKEKVIYNVLQTEMRPYKLFKIVQQDDGGYTDKEDQKIAQCLQENNFFYPSPYRYLDYTVKCGKDKDQIFFKQGTDYDVSCRNGFDPPDEYRK